MTAVNAPAASTSTASRPRAAGQSKSSSIFTAPAWVNALYSKFPLVVLDQDDALEWDTGAAHVLWVAPPASTSHSHARSWASSSPASLRAQLLFLLRAPAVPVQFRRWTHEESAPGGQLPALHLTGPNRVLGGDKVRGWLEEKHLLRGKSKEFNGLPDQASYDKALALARLVDTHLLPAYLMFLPAQPSDYHLLFPNPPPLAAGLTTPLPASLTGDRREFDRGEVLDKGIEALEALEHMIGEGWALDAQAPTPLDALIASHLYPIYALPPSWPLRNKLEQTTLGAYVDRVLAEAERHI
ncbi:hypothetical protein Q5752_006416 [Cryptotrichosporon argae]